MGGATQQVLDVVGMLYDAAMGEARWEPFLEHMRDTFAAWQAGVWTISAKNFGLTVDLGGQESWSARYVDYYKALDPAFSPRGLELMVPGAAITNPQLVSPREWRGSEFWNDFARPQDAAARAIVIASVSPQRLASGMSLLRSARSGEFSPDEQAALRMLAPHLARAFALRGRLAALDGALGALDCLPLGVLALDARGRLVEANRAGQRVLECADGLSVERGTVRAGAAFQRAVAEVAASTTRQPAALRVTRPSDRPPWSVLVAPASARPGLAAARAVVLVFVSDPAAVPLPRAALLEKLYGFTPAEADLAAELMRGASLHEAADRLAITANTARTHLKRIFAKTQVRRQSELIRVLSTGPANLVTP